MSPTPLVRSQLETVVAFLRKYARHGNVIPINREDAESAAQFITSKLDDEAVAGDDLAAG